MANTPFKFNYNQGPSVPGNAYGSAGGDLQSIWAKLMKDVNAGRPGVMEPLFQVLNGLGQMESAGLQRHQYESMAPYMTDAAQQGRFQFSTMAPYMTDEADWARTMRGAQTPYLSDPYEQARQAAQRAQDAWNMQSDYMRKFYGAASDDLTSMWRPLITGRQF